HLDRRRVLAVRKHDPEHGAVGIEVLGRTLDQLSVRVVGDHLETFGHGVCLSAKSVRPRLKTRPMADTEPPALDSSAIPGSTLSSESAPEGRAHLQPVPAQVAGSAGGAAAGRLAVHEWLGLAFPRRSGWNGAEGRATGGAHGFGHVAVVPDSTFGGDRV